MGPSGRKTTDLGLLAGLSGALPLGAAVDAHEVLQAVLLPQPLPVRPLYAGAMLGYPGTTNGANPVEFDPNPTEAAAPPPTPPPS